MTWGQVISETLLLQGNGKMFKIHFFPKVPEKMCYLSQDILIYWVTLDDTHAVLTQWPLLPVIRGHKSSNSFFLPLTFDRRGRALGMDPMCFFCKDASNDMQYDLLGSIRDLTSPWRKVKFWNWPFRSTRSYFDTFRREERDAAKIMSPAFLVNFFFRENPF